MTDDSSSRSRAAAEAMMRSPALTDPASSPLYQSVIVTAIAGEWMLSEQERRDLFRLAYGVVYGGAA